MPSTHSPFILQHSSKTAVGSNMALIHMDSSLCSVEHTMAAVLRQKLIQLLRGLNIVKFFFFQFRALPTCHLSPKKKKKATKNQHKPKALTEAPGFPEAANFNCSLAEQLQMRVSWQDILLNHGKIL